MFLVNCSIPGRETMRLGPRGDTGAWFAFRGFVLEPNSSYVGQDRAQADERRPSVGLSLAIRAFDDGNPAAPLGLASILPSCSHLLEHRLAEGDFLKICSGKTERSQVSA